MIASRRHLRLKLFEQILVQIAEPAAAERPAPAPIRTLSEDLSQSVSSSMDSSKPFAVDYIIILRHISLRIVYH